jgi:Leucine-rich repeat (LRR) protein
LSNNNFVDTFGFNSNNSCKSLKVLNLDNNEISKFKDISSSNLEELSISNMILTSFKNNSFPNLKRMLANNNTLLS